MLVSPTWTFEKVTDIDLTTLWDAGIRGFIFDLDNTLMAPFSGVLDKETDQWLTHISEKGFRAIVVSNNPRANYLKDVQEHLQIPVLGNAAKPRRKSLYRALELLELDATEVVVVGDRPLTDIWGGERLGAKTILVDPLTKDTEIVLIKFLRRLERMFVH